MDNITFFENIPVEFNEIALMERMQLRERLRASKDFLWAVEQAKGLIKPRGVVGIASVNGLTDDTVEIGGEIFTSRILCVNLESLEVVYPFIATIGPELENVASEQSSLTKKFFLELMGDYSLTTAMWYIEEKIKEKYSITRISSMSPGSLENWGIKQQVPLFNLFDSHAEKIGVKLTSSMLMLPRKSLSGIGFHSQRAFISCQLCPRDRCPGRRGKYTPELFAEYGLPIPEKKSVK
jgi:hypothetical protein